MCGRYHFNILPDNKGKQIKDRAKKLKLIYKEGEVFPGDNVLCMIPKDSKIDLDVFKWGIKSKTLLINARSETLDEIVTYKKIKNNRCAVITNGFYEWDKEKNKYFIKYNEKYMYLACIFNEFDELVILTKSSNGDFKRIHDRIPIIMNQEEMIKYIHGEKVDIKNKTLIIDKINQEINLF